MCSIKNCGGKAVLFVLCCPCILVNERTVRGNHADGVLTKQFSLYYVFKMTNCTRKRKNCERRPRTVPTKQLSLFLYFCSNCILGKNCKARTEFQQSSSLLFRILFSKCKTLLVKERTVPVRGTRQSSNSSSLCFLFK